MIYLLQRVLPGELPEGMKSQRGFRLTDGIPLVPLAIAMLFFGLFPSAVINLCAPWAEELFKISLAF
jgi:NADH:ubiquinone oxidoreductase subunit 4 (subunit M)